MTIKYIYRYLLMMAMIYFCHVSLAQNFTQYVNPFIGTTGNGHTFPGAAVPFGLIQASPETGNTGWKYTSGYDKGDTSIIGFAQTHLNGTGCSDLGDILLFPFSGNTYRKNFNSSFSKSTEKAMPGYYKVSLADSEIEVELTATRRTAFHKYTFRHGDAHLLVDLQSGISWNQKSLKTRVISAKVSFVNKQTIVGNQQVKVWVTRQLFYVIEFSKPFRINRELSQEPGEKGKRYILDFDVKPGESILVKVAISTVSVEGAKLNLSTENKDWDFERIKSKAAKAWNGLLSRVKAEGTSDQKINFYTSLYHLFLQPTNITDVNGNYRGANDSVFNAPSKQYYSTLSLWDTYRAAHPLYTILAPELVEGMINTLLSHYRTAGILPIWTLWGKENYCMISNPAIPVIVDAYFKGFKGFDVQKAYDAIKTSSLKDHKKSDWGVYNKYGYYPFDVVAEESVSRTLESCFDDYCVARMAKALGKKVDYINFSKRAGYYKNLFDVTTGFMRGKDSKGNWRSPFDTYALSHAGSAGGDYTEGNAWQYSWHVQHDIEGLATLFGGKDKLTQKLDSLFHLSTIRKSTGFSGDVSGLIGQYAQGNEPSHHVPYLFTMLGKPWRTQELVREITDTFYTNKPDGLCGNDDCGQMSAWYLFTAMGFYPVNPVSGQYILGAPQLPKITLMLPGNKTFVIEAKNLSAKNKYVKSIFLNGKIYEKLFIKHQDLMNGGLLVFTMSQHPIK